jgi:NAD(P) transhydrogenase subunit alpha
VLGVIAIVMSSINLVGGFVVTDRMLEMFAGRKPAKKSDQGGDA